MCVRVFVWVHVGGHSTLAWLNFSCVERVIWSRLSAICVYVSVFRLRFFIVKPYSLLCTQFPPTRFYVYLCGCARGCRLILAQKCLWIESPSTGMTITFDSYRSLCGLCSLCRESKIAIEHPTCEVYKHILCEWVCCCHLGPLGMLFVVCVCYLILAREIWIVFHNKLSVAYVTPSISVAIISFCFYSV